MKYSDFEKQMGDKLRSHEADLDTSAFYKELMGDKKRKRPFAAIFRLPLTLLGLITVALLISNFKKEDTKTDLSTTETQSNSQPNIQLTSSSNIVKDYDTIIKHNDIPVEQINTNNKSSSKITYEHVNSQELNAENKHATKTLSLDPTNQINLYKSSIEASNNISSTNLTFNQSNINSDKNSNFHTSSISDEIKSNEVHTVLDRSTIDLKALNILESNQISITQLIPRIKDVECPDFRINKGRMSIEILADAGFFFPMKTFIEQGSEINEVNDLRTAHESSKEGWHAGIYAKFRNTKWPVYIQAGISQDYLTERMSLQYEYIRRDTTQGIISITTSENGDTITAIIGDIVTETEVSGRKIKHYKIQTLDIPVTLGYSIGFDKFTVDLEGGVLLNLSMQSNGSILTSQSDFDDISNQKPFRSKLGLSYLGGISLGYHITPRSKVYINTKMRIIPGDVNSQNNTLSQKYNFLGLNLGFGYTF